MGLVVKPLHFFYDYAWFVGFFAAGGTYWAMMKMTAPVTGLEVAVEEEG